MSAYKKIADGLRLMAEGYEALATEPTAKEESKVETPTKEKKSAPKKETKTEPKETPKAAEPTEETDEEIKERVLAVKDEYTEDDIRKAIHYFNQRGKLDQIQKLFKEYGAKRAKDLKPEHFSEVMEKVRSLDA